MNDPALALFRSTRIVVPMLLVAVLPSLALGQLRPDPKPEVKITGTPAKTEKVNDLTARYRFFERFTPDDDHTSPGLVASSRIGIIDVVRESFDNAKGAPKSSEVTRQAIFTERPFEVNTLNNVNSVIRNYTRFTVKSADGTAMIGQPLEGLTLLVRPKPGDPPQILGLTEGRSLTETEYDVASHHVYISQLPTLLPAQVVRIGDTWKINRQAAQALLSEPSIVGDGLSGKLIEVRKEVDGPRMVALIRVSGVLPTPAGECTIKADILYTFLGESTLKMFDNAKPAFPPRPKEDWTEGRGSITEIRLARATTGFLPGPGRLRYRINRDITLERRPGLGEGVPSPPRLKQIPEPTDANSWLTYTDPNYKYSFQHPQDLLFPERNLAMPEPKTSFMTRADHEGRDILQIELVPKNLSPEDVKKEMAEKYNLIKTEVAKRQVKVEVTKGDELWLPEKEWPATMKVHRIESEMKLTDPKTASIGSTRMHFDSYLILTSHASSVVAIASTTRNNVAAYRREIEQILKSVRLDPPRPAVN